MIFPSFCSLVLLENKNGKDIVQPLDLFLKMGANQQLSADCRSIHSPMVVAC